MMDPVNKYDDNELIERCKAGEMAAFDELIRRYEKRAFTFAYRMSGNYDDANDISQEAFIRVFNAIGTFRGDANFTTWLYRIITNVFLDDRKKKKAHLHTSLEEHIQLEESSVERQIQDDKPLPDEVAEVRERNKIVQQAIQKLPDYQRAMVVLYHTQGKSYEEISQIMDMPMGTVKSRLNRARSALRELLEHEKDLFNL